MVAQHERKRHHPQGNGRITRPRRFATYLLAKTSRYRLPVVANSANRATLRDGTSYPSEIPAAVRVNWNCGVRVPRNKQLLPSLPLAIILSVCCTTTPSFMVLCPNLFFSKLCVLTRTRSMAAPQDKRTDDWASPKHFHRYAHRYARNRAEIQREESREWTVLSKEEPRSGNGTSAKNAKDEEARSVLPRGSVIQQHIIKLASIATRSGVLCQLTSTATKSTTLTSNSVTAARCSSGAPFGGNTVSAGTQRKTVECWACDSAGHLEHLE